MILSFFPHQESWLSDEEPATRFLVLRHGEVASEWRTGVLYGALDVPLSEHGKAQSRTTGEALRVHPIRAVYSSDLSRAAYLAGEVARHHALKPVLSSHLRERSFGDWQGQSWNDIEVRYPALLGEFLADRFTIRVPGSSENFVDVANRVVPFVKELLHRHRGETVAICCHSGPARLIVAAAMMLPLESLFTFDQDYCCLNVVDIYESGRTRVKCLNETAHLCPSDGRLA